MYVCKYLNFSRGNSEQDLLARRVIRKLEGPAGSGAHIAEYADAMTNAASACCSPSARNSASTRSAISRWTVCWRPSASTRSKGLHLLLDRKKE
jgi:hypothetical protein